MWCVCVCVCVCVCLWCVCGVFVVCLRVCLRVCCLWFPLLSWVEKSEPLLDSRLVCVCFASVFCFWWLESSGAHGFDLLYCVFVLHVGVCAWLLAFWSVSARVCEREVVMLCCAQMLDFALPSGAFVFVCCVI
jgi:hypothetical protein